MTEKSVVNDYLAKKCPEVRFEETPSQLDHAGDIDYMGKVGNSAFGIQIKPITANANLANYSVTARMEESFKSFEGEFGGKVFVVFSVEDKIMNLDVLDEIKSEINRLKKKNTPNCK